MAFEPIQSDFGRHKDFVNFKSKRDMDMFKKLQSLRNEYWTAIPHLLLYDHTIEPQVKILWIMLYHLGGKTGFSYYCQEKLAYIYGCSPKTISRYQKILVDHGYLEKRSSREHPSEDCFAIHPPECLMPGSEASYKAKNNFTC